jgi:hypothetical protein
LPVLNKLAGEYAEQGLAVLAINVGESHSTYQEFVRSNRYTYLHWGRDAAGEITELYRVRGIPVTYVLDREGVIRHTHVGYGTGMEEVFVQQIEALFD